MGNTVIIKVWERRFIEEEKNLSYFVMMFDACSIINKNSTCLGFPCFLWGREKKGKKADDYFRKQRQQ